MTEEYYQTPRDTFLAPTDRKPRISVPPRCTEEEKEQRKNDLVRAAQMHERLSI